MPKELSKPKIEQELQSTTAGLIDDLEVLEQIDSTNLQLKRTGSGDKFKVCIANTQTAGKGRLGKKWISPATNNIYFSISHKFPNPPSALSGLGLVAGILCAKTIKQLTGFDGIQLKWPNDLIANDKKLGGILIENHIGSNKESIIIIGIGINVAMPADTNIDVPWINLQDIGNTASRNQIISSLLNNLVPVINDFNDKTLSTMLTDWDRLDWTKNQPVKLSNKTSIIYGTAVGINSQGALRLKCDGKIKEIHSGDLSLRKDHVTA